MSFRYTRETFLFKMLNKAFFTQDVSILYKFQFFIKDLHTRLEQMHSLYKASLKSRVFTVYRGLSMPLPYFKRTIQDEIHHLIAFDSFLSTSLDETIARQFALNKQDPKNESVLFCIEIDVDKMERPFADISRWSNFKHEREVLFSFGTVFRIDDVTDKRSSDRIWVVHLSSVSEKDEQLQKETQQIQIALFKFFEDVLYTHRGANDFQKLPASNANVASVHYKQGEYNDSLLFYIKALNALNDLGEPDPLTKATYISNVAKAQKALGHNDEALVLYEQALEIRHLKCKSNDPSLIHTLHTIGEIYREKMDWKKALEQYNEALKLQLSSLKSHLLSDLSSIAATYVCIGNIFCEQEKYQDALDSFSNALKHQHEHLDEQHPVLAFLYNNIGAMYYRMKKYDLALENQLNCLKIESKALPKEHKTFADTYRNIATTYEKCRQYDEAIEFAQKCINQLKLSDLTDTSELKHAIDLLKRIEISRDNRK